MQFPGLRELDKCPGDVGHRGDLGQDPVRFGKQVALDGEQVRFAVADVVHPFGRLASPGGIEVDQVEVSGRLSQPLQSVSRVALDAETGPVFQDVENVPGGFAEGFIPFAVMGFARLAAEEPAVHAQPARQVGDAAAIRDEGLFVAGRRLTAALFQREAVRVVEFRMRVPGRQFVPDLPARFDDPRRPPHIDAWPTPGRQQQPPRIVIRVLLYELYEFFIRHISTKITFLHLFSG